MSPSLRGEQPEGPGRTGGYPSSEVHPRPFGRKALAHIAGHLASYVSLSVDEPEAVRRLHATIHSLHGAGRLDSLLPEILEGALSLIGADFGSVQIIDQATGTLRVAARSGCSPGFLNCFANTNDEHSACGRAARKCMQTVIADAGADAAFAPYREMAAAAGFRAVQATPLADHAGRLVGMVCTYFRRPHRPADRDLRILEIYGAFAGEALARHIPAPASRESDRPSRAVIVSVPCTRCGEAGAHAGHASAAPYAPHPPGTLEITLPELAFYVVSRLSTVGVSLASAQNLFREGAGGRPADREAAAAELDRAIAELRATVFSITDRDQLYEAVNGPVTPAPG